MALAQAYDFIAERTCGNVFNFNYTFYEPDGVTPVNLTGVTVHFKLDTITHATTGVTITTGGAAGTVDIAVSAALTIALDPAKEYLFYTKIIYADLTDEPTLIGLLKLRGGIA